MFYSKDHEWIKIDNDEGTIGISPHAIDQLGEIVFIELPENGKVVTKGDSVAIFESVKAASDIYTPVSGKIIDINENLNDDLTAITPDKAIDHWIFKIKLSNVNELEELMNEQEYNEMIS